MHCEAGLDDAGNPAGWLMRAAYPSIGSTFNAAADAPATWEAEMGLSDLPYDIPNVLVEVGKAKAHTRIGWLTARLSHLPEFRSFLLRGRTGSRCW